MSRWLADADDLTWMTRRVLHAFAAETRLRGHAVGRVVYAAGDAEWSFPIAFDEFLAVGHDLLSAELRQRTWANRAMGVSIALLSLELALVARERPELLPARRRDWEDTLFGFF